jgi:prepilin-type N-terminal cleavage/methylation domain-containing protein
LGELIATAPMSDSESNSGFDTRPRSGFSLLELLVVMLIMSVTMGLFLGYNHGQQGTVQMRAAANESRQFLRLAQGYALLEGRDNTCLYQTQGHVLTETLRGRELQLPEKVRLTVGDEASLSDANATVTVFYADGSSQGGEFSLAAEGQEVRLRIDPVLGEAEEVE